jgi:hypothetical protein
VRFEIFTAVKIPVILLGCDTMSGMVGYQYFISLRGYPVNSLRKIIGLKMVSYHITMWHHIPEDHAVNVLGSTFVYFSHILEYINI